MVAIESLENRKYRRKDNNNTNNIFSFTNYTSTIMLEITKEILRRCLEVFFNVQCISISWIHSEQDPISSRSHEMTCTVYTQVWKEC